MRWPWSTHTHTSMDPRAPGADELPVCSSGAFATTARGSDGSRSPPSRAAHSGSVLTEDIRLGPPRRGRGVRPRLRGGRAGPRESGWRSARSRSRPSGRRPPHAALCSVRRTAASATAACGTSKARCSLDDGCEPRTRRLDALGRPGERRRGRGSAASEGVESGHRLPLPRGQRGSDSACGGGAQQRAREPCGAARSRRGGVPVPGLRGRGARRHGQGGGNHGSVFYFPDSMPTRSKLCLQDEETSRFLIFKIPRSQYLVFDDLAAKTSAGFIKQTKLNRFTVGFLWPLYF